MYYVLWRAKAIEVVMEQEDTLRKDGPRRQNGKAWLLQVVKGVKKREEPLYILSSVHL